MASVPNSYNSHVHLYFLFFFFLILYLFMYCILLLFDVHYNCLRILPLGSSGRNLLEVCPPPGRLPVREHGN